MASFPEVEIPPEPETPEYDPEEEEQFVKKPRVDTDRIFKKKRQGRSDNEMKVSKMRTKKKVLYDNPMEEVKVVLPPEPEPQEEEITKEDVEQILNSKEPISHKIDEIDVKKEEVETEVKIKPPSMRVPSPTTELPVKPVKKKRQMSQKQLDALAKGRATSLAKRQANASTKKELKVVQKTAEPTPVFQKPQYLTKEDVKNISVEAISQYDSIRKQRKAKKKDVKVTHIADKRTQQQLNRALNGADADFYNDCFNITY